MTTAHELATKAKRLVDYYLFRKRFTIVGTTAGDQINYQMKLTVYRGSGIDSPGVVYLNNNCEFDFRDIRFTKSDGFTLLDYWIESIVPGVSAVVWIEFDFIPASPETATFYIYYGNPTATSASDGFNTFDWFDDFADGFISPSYTKIGYDGWSEAGGVLTFTTLGTTAFDPNVLRIDNKTYGWGFEIRVKFRVRQWQDDPHSRIGIGLRTDTSGRGYEGLFHWASGLGKTRAILHALVAWLSEAALGWTLGTWYWMCFYAKLIGTTRYLYEKDWAVGAAEPNVWSLTSTSTSVINQDGQPCIVGCSIPSGGFPTQFIGDYDDVFVRKRSDPEPTWGVWDSEESCLRYKFPQFSLRRKYYD